MSNKIHADKIATLVLELEESLAVESVNKEVMEKPLLEYLNREFPVVSANHQQLHAQIDLSNKEAAGEVLKKLLMMVNAKDDEIKALKNDVKINHEYAARIARHINVKFYPENTGFSPMADLYSVLSQIDNAVARVDRDAGRGQLPPLTDDEAIKHVNSVIAIYNEEGTKSAARYIADLANADRATPAERDINNAIKSVATLSVTPKQLDEFNDSSFIPVCANCGHSKGLHHDSGCVCVPDRDDLVKQCGCRNYQPEQSAVATPATAPSEPPADPPSEGVRFQAKNISDCIDICKDNDMTPITNGAMKEILKAIRFDVMRLAELRKGRGITTGKTE